MRVLALRSVKIFSDGFNVLRSRKHAFVDLNEKFLDQSAACLGTKHFQGSATVESPFGRIEPGSGAVDVGKDRNSAVEDTNDAGKFVGLVDGERLAASAAVFEGAGRDDDAVEVFEWDTGGGDELGYCCEGDTGLDAGQVEVEGGGEGFGRKRFGWGCHRTLCHRCGGKVSGRLLSGDGPSQD
jgi:hypothetical protein